MNVNPLADRVFISRAPRKTSSDAGILLPENAKQPQDVGTVTYAGPEATSVEEGDRVIFSPHAGTDLELNGEKLLVVREDDIFAVVEP